MNIKKWIANKLYHWLEIYMPEAMHQRIKELSDKIAADVSMQLAMAFLDREKLLHCDSCAIRHGLHRAQIEEHEVYLCDKHYSQWQSQRMAEAQK